jgi:hypothetical protein
MKKKALYLITLALILVVLLFGIKFFSKEKLSYVVLRQVRYSFTLKNITNNVISNVRFLVYAPVKQTATQLVKTIDCSYPYKLVKDQFGNQILSFSFSDLAPYATTIIKIKTNLALSPVSNKMPLSINAKEFVKPEIYVESDNPDIVFKAKSFKTKDDLQTAQAIHKWVFNHINYSGYLQKEKGAYYALKHKAGDCTEYMDLFSALCRANNIPCKRVGGYLTDKDAVLKSSDYHNWVEFFDGKKWIIADPQNSKFMDESENYIATRIISSSIENIMQDHDMFKVFGDGVKVTMNL